MVNAGLRRGSRISTNPSGRSLSGLGDTRKMPEPTRTYYSQLLEAYAKLHGPVTLVFYLDRSHTTRLPHLGQDSQNEALGSSELRAAARVSSLPIIHPSHVHGIRCFHRVLSIWKDPARKRASRIKTLISVEDLNGLRSIVLSFELTARHHDFISSPPK